MRKTTKVLSLLLTLAMILTMALPMSVSAAFSDVPSSHHYYKAITNLAAEGILNGFDDGSFKPEDPVTRAQFTKIICYALSVGDLKYSDEEKSIFTDLAPNHWAADNIVTAYKQKIINGMGDGTFAPESGVQYEQAVKMVVCALGYSQKRADDLGGYPNGYMALASQAKLLKGITDAKMYQVMNRGAVAQLIDNMLDANQIQDGQQSGSIREEVSTSKSLDGRVVAGYGVALYPDAELEACRKNEILLSVGNTNIPFDVSELNNFDIYEYLGRSVTVYYEKESGVTVDVVSSIAFQNRKNETVKIDLDMIYDYDSSSIEYYVDAERNETEIVTYQTTSYNLWNGQPDTRSVKELLDLDTNPGIDIDRNINKPGYITLVSSQANQSADVAFLKTYETIIVESVVTKDSKVFPINNTSESVYVLDVTDRTKNVTIKQNGNDYPLSSIRTNNVLSISADPTGKVIEVLVSTKTASGTIELMSTTPNTQIKLNNSNTIYTVSPMVYDAIANVSGASAIASLEVGKYVALSLDAFGKVARFAITAESSYNYGYIGTLEDSLGTSANPEIWVQMYKPGTTNSTLKGQIVKFADKIKINGRNYNVTDDFNDIKDALISSASMFNGVIGTDAPINARYSQPVRYTLNNSNQVNAIITATSRTAPADNTTNLNIIDKTASGILCKVDGSTFDQYIIKSSTPVIYIPQDRASGTYSSKTNTFFDEGESYYVQFANTTTANQVGCVYLYGVVGGSGSLTETITDEDKPLIVKEKGTVLYKDVNTTKLTLTDVTNGAEVVCYEDAVSVAALEVGDVVRVAIGADEYIEALEVLADAAEVSAGTFSYAGNYFTSADIQDEFRALLGTIRSREGNTFVVIPGYNGGADASTGETYTAAEGIPVYKIDADLAENARIETSSTGELLGYITNPEVASRVLVYTVEGVAKAVIIFE